MSEADTFYTTAELATRWKVSEDTAARRIDEYDLALPFKPRRVPAARLAKFENASGTQEVSGSVAKKKPGRKPKHRPAIDHSVLAGL